jgi:uncharacterized protein (TIGR00369 family)
MDSNYDTMAQIPEDLKEDLEPDIQARVENVINSNIARTLGFSFVESGTDYCIARLQRSDGVINSNGRVNGGVISAFIDKVATAAAWANNVNGPGSRGTTINLTVNYMSAGAKTDLIGTARVSRRGGSVVFVTVDVHDENGGFVAQGLATYKLNPKPRQ